MPTPKEDAATLRVVAIGVHDEGDLTAAKCLNRIATRLEAMPEYPKQSPPALDWSKPLRTVGGGDVKVIWVERKYSYHNVKVSHGDWSFVGGFEDDGTFRGSNAGPDHPWNLCNALTNTGAEE